MPESTARMRLSAVVIGVIAGLLGRVRATGSAARAATPGSRPTARRAGPRYAAILHARGCPMLADSCPPPSLPHGDPHEAHAPDAARARRSLRPRRALARAAARALDRKSTRLNSSHIPL